MPINPGGMYIPNPSFTNVAFPTNSGGGSAPSYNPYPAMNWNLPQLEFPVFTGLPEEPVAEEEVPETPEVPLTPVPTTTPTNEGGDGGVPEGGWVAGPTGWRGQIEGLKGYDSEYWGLSGYIPKPYQQGGSIFDQMKYAFNSLAPSGKFLGSVVNSWGSAVPLGSILGPLAGILGSKPTSGLNPANNPQVREGLNYAWQGSSPEFRSVFGNTVQEFNNFVNGMFGSGRSWNAKATPQVQKIADYLGWKSYTPKQLNQLALDLRVNATRSLQGLQFDATHVDFNDNVLGQWNSQVQTILGGKSSFGSVQLGDAFEINILEKASGMPTGSIGLAATTGFLSTVDINKAFHEGGLTDEQKAEVADKGMNAASAAISRANNNMMQANPTSENINKAFENLQTQMGITNHAFTDSATKAGVAVELINVATKAVSSGNPIDLSIGLNKVSGTVSEGGKTPAPASAPAGTTSTKSLAHPDNIARGEGGGSSNTNAGGSQDPTSGEIEGARGPSGYL